MRTCAELTWPSTRFPHLRPLANFLNGESDAFELYRSEPHTRASNLHVMVFDLFQDGKRLIARISERIRDYQRLLECVNEELPEEVQLRVYLVSSMSSRVADILGTALECPPEVFGSHLYPHRRCPKSGCTGNAGEYYRGCTGCGVELHNPMQAPSLLSSIPLSYFSLPFRRPIVYNPAAKEGSRSEQQNLLVERISGTWHKHPVNGKYVGKPVSPNPPRSPTKCKRFKRPARLPISSARLIKLSPLDSKCAKVSCRSPTV